MKGKVKHPTEDVEKGKVKYPMKDLEEYLKVLSNDNFTSPIVIIESNDYDRIFAKLKIATNILGEKFQKPFNIIPVDPLTLSKGAFVTQYKEGDSPEGALKYVEGKNIQDPVIDEFLNSYQKELTEELKNRQQRIVNGQNIPSQIPIPNSQPQRSNDFKTNVSYYISKDRLAKETPIFLYHGLPKQDDIDEIIRITKDEAVSQNRTGGNFFFVIITDNPAVHTLLVDVPSKRSIQDRFISEEEAVFFGIKHYFPGLTYKELISQDVQESLAKGNYEPVIKILTNKFDGVADVVSITMPNKINTEAYPVFDATARSITMSMKRGHELRGTLLIGVPGSGKTMFANTLAKMTNSMLVEINIERILNPLVGVSEQNFDKLKEFLSLLKPAVILIDEIDKRMAAGSKDNQVVNNIKAKLLNWLAQGKVGQYVVATANNPSALSAELTRQGRWDYVFKVPPPPRSVRTSIVEHYAKVYDLPIIRELIDGGTVSIKGETKNIDQNLITPADISGFYNNLKNRWETAQTFGSKASIYDLAYRTLAVYSFSYESDEWREVNKTINGLGGPSIYNYEDSLREDFGMDPLIPKEDQPESGNPYLENIGGLEF